MDRKLKHVLTEKLAEERWQSSLLPGGENQMKSLKSHDLDRAEAQGIYSFEAPLQTIFAPSDRNP